MTEDTAAREAFEAWRRANYVYERNDDMWIGWFACWNARSTPDAASVIVCQECDGEQVL